MILLNDLLPLLLSILGVILLVVLIVIGFKIIRLMNNIEEIVEDVTYKVKSLNNIFRIIDRLTDSLSIVSDKLVESINSFLIKMFKKKYNKKKEEKENEQGKEEEE